MDGTRWLPVWALAGLWGCVDVPERADPADARPPVADAAHDAVPDAAADRGPGPGADMAADARVDAGPDARVDVAVDAAPDMRRVDGGADMAPDAEPDAEPDAAPDMGPPDPFDGCLAPRGGVYSPELPCVRVSVVGGDEPRSVMAAAITVAEGTPDERVAVVGGLDGTGAAPAGATRVRLYDPAQGRWLRDGPELPGGRWGHGLGLRADGAVVVAGGATARAADGGWSAEGEVYVWQPDDPERAGWQVEATEMDPPRSEGLAVTVPRLGVLYVGGATESVGPPLDHVTGIFGPGGVQNGTRISHARLAPMATPLPDSSVLIVGGLGPGGAPVAIAERVAGPGDALRVLPTPPALHSQGAAAPLADGALIVGGVEAEGVSSSAAYRYDSRYNRFVSLPPLAVARVRPTLTPIGPDGEGWHLVVGGTPPDAPAGLVELYDPVGDRFVAFELPALLQRRRWLHSAAAFSAEGGRAVLVVGGYAPLRNPVDDLRDPVRYVSSTLRFDLELPPDVARPLPDDCLEPIDPQVAAPCLRVRRGPPLSSPRTALAAVAVRDGPVVVSGGLDPAGPARLGTVEALYPGDRAWAALPGLAVPRWGHWMLAEGTDADSPLVVLGGVGNTDEMLLGLGIIERLNVGDRLWVNNGAVDLDVPRMNAALIGTADEVILVGGQSSVPGAPLADVERLTGQGGEALPSLQIARTRAAGCPLDAGLVMVYGGFTAVSTATSIEVYELSEDGAPGEWGVGWPDALPLGDSTCIGGGGQADIFGGRATPDGAASASWQRFSAVADPYRVIGEMARGRIEPTVNAIGQQGAPQPAHLIVGGEDRRDAAERPVVVELIYRDLDTRFAYTLPAGFAPRRSHVGVSHRFVSARAPDGLITYWRDVVIAGGEHAVTGEALDEVLIFRLDPFEPAAAP